MRGLRRRLAPALVLTQRVLIVCGPLILKARTKRPIT